MISAIFHNHIHHLLSEVHYYESLIEEKRQEAEKLEGIQDKVSSLIGLAEEIKDDVVAIDARHLETVKEELNKIFINSPNSVTSEEETTDNGEDDFQDPEDNNNGGNSTTTPDPQPEDGGNQVEPEEEEEELIDQPKVESKSNDYIDWVKTSNPNVAYFKTKHNSEIRCYIGSNNKTKLKSWATNLQNLISGLGTEVRDGSRLNYKHELKLYNLTEQDCQWLVSLDFDKKPSEGLIPESTRMTETKIEINSEEVPTGCFLERSKDWAVLEYYVYIYSRQFNPKERCFEIDSKRIGRLVQYDNFISAWRNRAAVSGDFTNTSDAIDYLLRTSSLSREDIAKAYYKKFPEEEQTPYGTCECGHAFDIPGVDANHCPECGWIGRSDSEQPEQTYQVAATAPDPFGGFNG